MSARQSSAVDKALRLVAGGMTAYAAARKVSIALSTIYRALARQRREGMNNITGKMVRWHDPYSNALHQARVISVGEDSTQIEQLSGSVVEVRDSVRRLAIARGDIMRDHDND